MDIVGSGLFRGPDFFAETAKIGGKNGGGNLHWQTPCFLRERANFFTVEIAENKTGII
jgi:hypothetical protein